jgi:RNA polymerase sigma-70 factor, ECF subfamily
MATPPQASPPTRTSSAIDDVEIMRRIQAGDERALDEVLARYWQPLVRYAWNLTGARDAAEDAAQEALVRLWQKRAAWTATTSLRGFLYRILRNHVLNEKRAERVRLRWRDRILRSGRPRVPTPADLFDDEELAEAVQAAIDALPDRRREVFVLSRFSGLSYEEIATTLEISPQTVANQMTAALRTLRGHLSAHLPPGGRSHLRVVPGAQRD